jgi:hypothetical protein
MRSKLIAYETLPEWQEAQQNYSHQDTCKCHTLWLIGASVQYFETGDCPCPTLHRHSKQHIEWLDKPQQCQQQRTCPITISDIWAALVSSAVQIAWAFSF